MVSRFFSLFLKSSYSELMHFGCFLCCIGTLKGVYDVEDHSFIPTSKATRGGPRNSGLTGVPYARFYNRFGDYILLTIGYFFLLCQFWELQLW